MINKRNFLLIAAALICGTAPAAAHAFLQHASPSAGAVLQVPPPEVQLVLSEPLEPKFSSLAVVDARGQDVTAAPAQIGGKTMSVKLKPLAPGSYVVRWRALSVDTHVTEGSFGFTVVRAQ